MCTIGALSTVEESGKRRVLMFKNMDAFQTPYWHTNVENTNGYRWLSFSIAAQAGTNSGVNEAGLGLVISGSDHRWISDEAPGWDIEEPPLDMRDARCVANAAILGRCRSVDEAIDFLFDWVPAHPEMMGGNTMLADVSGRIVIVEHCAGDMAMRDETAAGRASQANNSYVLIADEESARPGIQDSYPRCRRMGEFLADLEPALGHMQTEELLERARELLGSHEAEDAAQTGAVCIHGLDLPGARANVSLPLWTITGMVLDVSARRMHYTRGNPCQGAWEELEL